MSPNKYRVMITRVDGSRFSKTINGIQDAINLKWQLEKENQKEEKMDKEQLITKRTFENISVEEGIELFLAYRKQMVDKGELEITTYEDNLLMTKSRYIRDDKLLTMKVRDVKKKDAQEYVDGLYQLKSVKDGKENDKLSVNTLNNPFKLIHILFEYFRKELEIIDTNPFSLVKNKPLYKPKNQKYLIAEEIKVVIDALEKENIRMRAFINLFLETGLRIEEITAIKFSDLNHIRNTLQIQRALVKSKLTGDLIIKDVKTEGSEREINISKYTFSLLDNLRKFKENAGFIINNDDYVFTSWNENELISPSRYTDQWRTFIKKTGFDELPLRNLRHSMATFMLQGDTNLKAVKKRFGWSKDSTVFNIYNQSSLYEDKKLLEKFEMEFRNTFGLSTIDLYKICTNRFNDKLKLVKFVEDLTQERIDEFNYEEQLEKCTNYLLELFPIFKKIKKIDSELNDEEIDAMLSGFNDLYQQIKIQSFDDFDHHFSI